MVKFKFGPNAKVFIVHKQYAYAASDVLTAAFNTESGFIEGQTQTYTMEDVSEEVGRLLVHWIYKQKSDLDFEDPAADNHLVELWRNTSRPFKSTGLIWAENCIECRGKL